MLGHHPTHGLQSEVGDQAARLLRGESVEMQLHVGGERGKECVVRLEQSEGQVGLQSNNGDSWNTTDRNTDD